MFHFLPMDSPIAIPCRVCGSSHVSRDAWADWDVASQSWVLGAVFDQGFCHQCEEEQRLEECALEGIAS
jgi:hypothetical protein